MLVMGRVATRLSTRIEAIELPTSFFACSPAGFTITASSEYGESVSARSADAVWPAATVSVRDAVAYPTALTRTVIGPPGTRESV